MNIDANNPCKNLLNMYKLVLISVLAKKLQHCANIDSPLNPIKKLEKVTFIIIEEEATLEVLLQPIVISNNPLIKA